MERVQTKMRKGEGGFTLVELAIVMIIIGLLITGVLKGQEMIGNAQITSTIAQTKGYEAALSAFRERYNALPGDVLSPNTRIPNCGPVCARVGNANGRIGTGPGVAYATLAFENGAAWAQLLAANLITGIDQTSALAGVPASGVSIPAASLSGSSWQIGHSQSGALTAQTSAANAQAGHYILLDNSLTLAAAVGTASLSPVQAAQIDRKIDDGQPNGGTVRGMGAASNVGCSDDNTPTGVYNEALQGNLCGIYVRIQN